MYLCLVEDADVGGKEVSRYIDADNVIAQLKEYIDVYSWVDENGMHGLKWCAMMEALDVVEEAVQHEHGQWIEREPYVNTFECSNCNHWFVLEDGSPAENNYNYCPNCGAKMGVEE